MRDREGLTLRVMLRARLLPFCLGFGGGLLDRDCDTDLVKLRALRPRAGAGGETDLDSLRVMLRPLITLPLRGGLLDLESDRLE